ncbi:hypothetical protein [Clostridium lundense]|uniref:hypothetical protein n=1 Tax=Clostridium lundense TaxID=319475 RepID=UPI00068849A2|nr:hypothetical protein [Clostridium lundense]
MTIDEWKEKNKYAKGYAHFDNKVSLKQIFKYISNPNNVKKHGFYPFIHYTQKFNKYRHGKIQSKKRELCYSAHIDRYIYSYYGYMINEYYNKRVIEDKINKVAIAYRNNLKRNNIHFAKEAIDFIRKLENCYIIVGDFTNFFDNLDHNYLKSRLCDLLHVKRLPDDYYAVYKNIIKYSKLELRDILEYYSLKDSVKAIRTLNESSFYN